MYNTQGQGEALMVVQIYKTTNSEKKLLDNFADDVKVINVPFTKLSQCHKMPAIKHPALTPVVILVLLDPDTGLYWISALCEKRLSWTLNQIANLVARIYRCAAKHENKEKYNCDSRTLSKFIIKSALQEQYIIPKVD